MKSIWSVPSVPCFVLCALCSPPGFSCPRKSRSSQASNVSRGPEPRKWRARNVWARAGPKGSTPSGSRNLDGTPSVGGGRKTPRPCPRLLIFNPFGVQTKKRGMTVTKQPGGGGHRFGRRRQAYKAGRWSASRVSMERGAFSPGRNRICSASWIRWRIGLRFWKRSRIHSRRFIWGK